MLDIFKAMLKASLSKPNRSFALVALNWLKLHMLAAQKSVAGRWLNQAWPRLALEGPKWPRRGALGPLYFFSFMGPAYSFDMLITLISLGL